MARHDPRSLKDQAAAALDKGKFKRALELYLELESAEPADAQWPRRAAEMYRRLGKNDEAIGAFERAADKYVQAGFLVKAVAMFKLILQMQPGHAGVTERLKALDTQRGIHTEVKRSDQAGSDMDAQPEESEEPQQLLSPPRGAPEPGIARRGPGQGGPEPAAVGQDMRARVPAGAPGPTAAGAPGPTAAAGAPGPAAAAAGMPGPAAAVGPAAAGRMGPAARAPGLPLPSASASQGAPLVPPEAAPTKPPGQPVPQRPAVGEGRTAPAVHGLGGTTKQPATSAVVPPAVVREQTAGAERAAPSARSPVIELDAEALSEDLDEPEIEIIAEPESEPDEPDEVIELDELDEADIELEEEAEIELEEPALELRPPSIELRPPSIELARPNHRLNLPLPPRALPDPPTPEQAPSLRGRRRARPTIPPDMPLEAVSLGEVVPGARPITADGVPVDLADHDSGIIEIPIEFEEERTVPGSPLTPEVQRALRRTPLLSSLGLAAMHRLVHEVTLVSLEPEQVLFHEGDPGAELYIIVDGGVSVILEGPPRMQLSQLGEGDFFGEIALVTNQPRTATIVADSERGAQLMVIDRNTISELVETEPSVLPALLALLRERLVDRLIQISPLFAPFAGEERRSLVDRFRFLEIQSGAVLIEQGQRASGLFILLSGQVEAVHVSGDNERRLGTLESGGVCGEMSLLANEAALWTIRATTKGFALQLPAEVFREVIMTHPQVLMYVAELADERRQRIEAILEGDTDYDVGHISLF